MKKKLTERVGFVNLSKILRIMRVTAFLLFVFVAQIWAMDSYSQQTRLSLNLEQAKVMDVLNEIEVKSDFYFLFNKKMVDTERRVTISAENSRINEILSELFEGTNVNYVIKERQVVLTTKKVENGFVQQSNDVKGKVSDSTGAGLPGVSILIKGTTTGTISDFDGNFDLSNVPADATLVFSFVGMKTQEVIVAGQTNFNITMEDDAIGIEEVVAIGYGTVKKKDVTGSIVNVDIEDFGDRPASSVTEALQGMVAGVTVSNNGGSPAEGPTVRIRGLSTLNSEGPLWIVDGVINSNGVDPNEIESMTVLKDASAAIYGTRAAAGVILVTTKSGKKGLNVSLDVKYGWSTPWKEMDALNAEQYCDFYTDVYQAAGQTVPALLSDSYFRTTRTDWLDAIFQTGITQDYSLTVSGGSEKSTFSIFANWKDKTGTLHNTFNESGRIRIKSDHKINNRITFGQNLSVTTGTSRGTNTTSGYTGTILGAIYYPPSAKIWSDEANGIYSGVVDPNDVDISLAGQFGDLLNPYAQLDRMNGDNPNINAMLNAYVELKLIEGLKFKSNITYNYSQNYSKSFTYRILEPGKVYDYNRLSASANVRKSLVAEQLLTYEKTFDKHRISALAGYTAEEYDYQGFGASARNFSTEEEWAQEFVNAGDFNTDKPYSGFWDNSLVSMLGRIAYTYDNKYYLTGVVRRDGTSKVTKDYRWGTFPSVSAAWRISQEDFMSGINGLDDLKIRASWGKMGNISPLGNYEFAVPLSSTYVLLGEDPLREKAYYMNGISNEELQWETTTSLDFGFDALFMDSRLTIAADYYIKTVNDMLVRPELIQFAGVNNAPWINVGEVENKGFELMVGWNDQAGDLNYSISANISNNENELVKYTDTKDFEVHGTHARYTLYPFRSEVGQPLYSYYLIKHDGIFQTDAEAQSYTKDGQMIQPNAKAGDLKFIDFNNDGKIDSGDKQFCGDYYPDFTYGLNFAFEYKNWDCSMLFQGVQGVDIFAGYKYSTYKPTQGYNVLSEALDAWSTSNTGSDIPRLTLIDENHNYSTESDWYLEDGSYLRLKNITLGYTLPAEITKKIGTSKIRLFATSQNLLTITGYKGFDPEVGNYGLDMLKYPQARTIMLGANINF